MTVNDILQQILTERPLKWKRRYKRVYNAVFELKVFDNVDFLKYYTEDITFQYLCKHYKDMSLRRYKQKLLNLHIINENMTSTIFEAIKQIYPSYIANTIASVAPMTMPTGNIFMLKPTYVPGVTV